MTCAPSGWVVALILAICCALRLARFNVALDDPDKPAWTMNYLHRRAGARRRGACAAARCISASSASSATAMTSCGSLRPISSRVAILMVSRIPTYSGKTMGSRVSREMVLPILGLAAIAIVCLFTFTWQMLTVLACSISR